MSRQVYVATLFVLLAASASGQTPEAKKKHDDAKIAAATQYETAQAAAHKVRLERVQAANDAYKATLKSALVILKAQRKLRFDEAVVAFDARIKQITQSGDLDKAIAARDERDKFLREAAAEEASLNKEWETLTGSAWADVPQIQRPGNQPFPATSDLSILVARLKDRAERSFVNAIVMKPANQASDTTWGAHEVGHRLDGTIKVGNSDRNNGGQWIGANVTAEPGFMLSGGVIRASGGTVTFKGTAEKPVVLKGVRIECEYTATIKAEHTIFVGCTFTKAGNWFWNDGYSSKWEFANCLLLDSHFERLTRMDFGIKWMGCTFCDCRWPRRNWGYRKEEGPEESGSVRSEWSNMRDCDFYQCELSVSAIWPTENCNFIACRVGENDDFTSKANFPVVLGLAANDRLLVELGAKTAHLGTGKITYARASLSPNSVVRHPLWRWVNGAATPRPAQAAPPKNIFESGR